MNFKIKIGTILESNKLLEEMKELTQNLKNNENESGYECVMVEFTIIESKIENQYPQLFYDIQNSILHQFYSMPTRKNLISIKGISTEIDQEMQTTIEIHYLFNESTVDEHIALLKSQFNITQLQKSTAYLKEESIKEMLVILFLMNLEEKMNFILLERSLVDKEIFDLRNDISGICIVLNIDTLEFRIDYNPSTGKAILSTTSFLILGIRVYKYLKMNWNDFEIEDRVFYGLPHFCKFILDKDKPNNLRDEKIYVCNMNYYMERYKLKSDFFRLPPLEQIFKGRLFSIINFPKILNILENLEETSVCHVIDIRYSKNTYKSYPAFNTRNRSAIEEQIGFVPSNKISFKYSKNKPDINIVAPNTPASPLPEKITIPITSELSALQRCGILDEINTFQKKICELESEGKIITLRTNLNKFGESHQYLIEIVEKLYGIMNKLTAYQYHSISPHQRSPRAISPRSSPCILRRLSSPLRLPLQSESLIGKSEEFRLRSPDKRSHNAGLEKNRFIRLPSLSPPHSYIQQFKPLKEPKKPLLKKSEGQEIPFDASLFEQSFKNSQKDVTEEMMEERKNYIKEKIKEANLELQQDKETFDYQFRKNTLEIQKSKKVNISDVKGIREIPKREELPKKRKKKCTFDTLLIKTNKKQKGKKNYLINE